MAGERQLADRREDAHARGAVSAGRPEDERGLGQVHLARDGLHLGVGEAGGLEHDGERVTAEEPVGEDVDLDEAILARHA